MAKAGKYTGESFSDDELNDPEPPVVIRRAMLGGEPSSAGNNLEPSGPKTKQQEQPLKQAPQEPAPAVNPSSASTETQESSAARSTGGSGPETGKGSSRRRKPATSRKTAEDENPNAARVRSTDDDDFDDFE